MKYAADFRRIAREALRGKWPIAVLVGLVAVLLGGAVSSGPEVEIDIDVEHVNASFGFAGQTLFSARVRPNKPPPSAFPPVRFAVCVLSLDVIADQGLQQIVAVDAADDGARILVGRDIGGVLRQNIAYQLVDGVVALFLQCPVDLQNCLFDLHITVITDGKNSSRLRDRHIRSPLLSVILSTL